MTLAEFQAEVDRILARSLQIRKGKRLNWVKSELGKLPPEYYEFTFQFVSSIEVLVEDRLDMKTVIRQLIVSAACIGIGTILAFTFKEPTGVQYLFMRGLFVLGFAGLAVGIFVGTIKLEWSLTKSLLITATGGFALLLLIYYFNPPAPPSPAPLSAGSSQFQKVDQTNR